MVTQEELKSILNYDRITGVFTWKVKKSQKISIGDVTGCPNHDGYLIIGINGKKYRAHVLAWIYVYGNKPVNEIDHINRVKSDNSIDNLRDVTRVENCANKGVRADNKSGISGVYWHEKKGKWECYKTTNNIRVHIGYFETKDEAAKAIKAFRGLNDSIV